MKIGKILFNKKGIEKIKNNNTLEKTSPYRKVVKGVIGFITLATIIFCLTGCNRGFVDLEYAQNNALFVGDDTSIVMEIKNWKDYEGEQYQINTNDGLIMLTASFDTDLFFGNSNNHPVSKFARQAISENGEMYDLGTDASRRFNYEILDLNWKFNKAALFNGNKAAVLNINKWRDYEGEQLQVETLDGMTLLLSSYNSKLFYDKQSTIKAEDFAKMYVGTDGTVKTLGTETNPGFINYDFWDLKYNFNKIIIFKDKKAIILPVDEWKDYEGEQLQIKVIDGPIILTAAYDSILVNDTKSKLKADDIAKSISDDVLDLTVGKELRTGFLNKDLFDFEYGFGNGVISNDNSAASIPITKWCDYEGEQLQVIFPNNDVMLTSSIYLDMVRHGTKDLNANILAGYYSDDKVTLNATEVIGKNSYNRQFFDFNNSFNYALHVENGNVTILPLKKWRDYYNGYGLKSYNRYENPDGTFHVLVTDYDDEDPSSPNCEQLQLVLPDDTVLFTSAYDTILISTKGDINYYAEMFRGANGVTTDLTNVFGKPQVSGWNLKFFDTKWKKFNYAIYNNGQNSQIFEIKKWLDYADGEQLQIYFVDNGGIVTTYINTTLVYSQDEKKVETIAKAFAGEQTKGKVYKYYNN